MFRLFAATFAIPLIGCAIGLSHHAVGSDASESFHIIAPDKNGQQILSLLVTRTNDRVEIEQEPSIPVDFAPSSITCDPKRRTIYVSGSNDLEKSQSTIAVIASRPAEGLTGPSEALKSPSEALKNHSEALNSPSEQLKILRQSSHPFRPGYSSIDRSGQYLLTANYQTGQVSILAIRDDGLIGDITYQTTTPKPEAHCILTTPDNRFAYVPSVKENNGLAQYFFDATSGTLAPMTPIDAEPPAMFGPRHVAYHPNLPIAYFSNEQQLGISVYRIAKDGQLNDRQHAASLPRRDPYIKGSRGLHASDLVLSPTGELLFLAVRDFVGDQDSVFTYRVANDGRLSLLERTKVGDIPWKLDLSPDGTMLCVSEAFEHRLSIYKISSKGELSPAAACNWDTEVRDMIVLPNAE